MTDVTPVAPVQRRFQKRLTPHQKRIAIKIGRQRQAVVKASAVRLAAEDRWPLPVAVARRLRRHDEFRDWCREARFDPVIYDVGFPAGLSHLHNKGWLRIVWNDWSFPVYEITPLAFDYMTKNGWLDDE